MEASDGGPPLRKRAPRGDGTAEVLSGVAAAALCAAGYAPPAVPGWPVAIQDLGEERGFGAIATRDLAPGELVLQEDKPLFVSEAACIEERPSSLRSGAFEAAMEDMGVDAFEAYEPLDALAACTADPARLASILSLACPAPREGAESAHARLHALPGRIGEVLGALAERLEASSRCAHAACCWALAAKPALYVRIFGVLASNGRGTGDGGKRALYRIGSRFNSSCMPNCTEHGGSIRALTQIAAGQELTLAYLTDAQLLIGDAALRRAALWEGWAFGCACERCVPRTEACADSGLTAVMYRIATELVHTDGGDESLLAHAQECCSREELRAAVLSAEELRAPECWRASLGHWVLALWMLGDSCTAQRDEIVKHLQGRIKGNEAELPGLPVWNTVQCHE
jgi:hypothetical protein